MAVVTGASRGLGLLIARELGRRGHDLVICSRDTDGVTGAARRLAADIDGSVRVLPVRCDVAEREQCDRLIEKTIEHYGRLDVLVNNAGVIQVGPLASMVHEDFEEAMDIMYFGTLYPTLAALPHLRRTRGRLVNITSVGGKVSVPHLLPYSAAKFAAVGLSEGLHAELAADGVAVTTVVPGLMRTGSPINAMFKGNARNEYAWFKLGDSIPLMTAGAERAARRVVDAAMRRRAEVHITPLPRLASAAVGLLPGTTSRALGVVNRLLPSGTDQERVTGHEADGGDMPGWFRAGTTLTRRAERRYRAHEDPTRLGGAPVGAAVPGSGPDVR